jgi:hypothetical protein
VLGEQPQDHAGGRPGQLQGQAGRGDGRLQRGQGAAGQGQGEQEHRQPAELVAAGPAPASRPEGQAPVGSGVGHGGDTQRGQVGRLRAEPQALAQQRVQGHVGQGAGRAHGGEPDELAGQANRHPRGGRLERRPAELGAQLADREGAGGQRPADPDDALEVGHRGGEEVDPAVGVVDPLHRHLVDAEPSRSARTSSSVSKNQPVSSTWGSSRPATSLRIALKPHWASENRAASVPRSSSAARSVDRSTSM